MNRVIGAFINGRKFHPEIKVESWAPLLMSLVTSHTLHHHSKPKNLVKWVEFSLGFRSRNHAKIWMLMLASCMMGYIRSKEVTYFFIVPKCPKLKILRPSLLKGQIYVEDRYIPYHPWMVYLPTCRLLTFMVNVGKHTIHGYYGYIPIVDYGSLFPIAMNYIYIYQDSPNVSRNRQDFFRWICGSKMNFVLTTYIFC